MGGEKEVVGVVKAAHAETRDAISGSYVMYDEVESGGPSALYRT